MKKQTSVAKVVSEFVFNTSLPERRRKKRNFRSKGSEWFCVKHLIRRTWMKKKKISGAKVLSDFVFNTLSEEHRRRKKIRSKSSESVFDTSSAPEWKILDLNM